MKAEADRERSGVFTGIIEAMGRVERIEPGRPAVRMTFTGPDWTSDMAIGASVAVNGACLTVVAAGDRRFSVDAVPETLARTNLGALKPGDAVNLERAAKLGDRLDGHLVTGHVDGTGTLLAIRADGDVHWLTVQAPPAVMRYLVPKGSVTLDGISLTVVDHEDDRFRVTIVPHTWRVTNLHERKVGDKVNLEADLIGKYVERFVRPYVSQDGGVADG